MSDDDDLLDALYLGATAEREFERALTMLSERFGCRSVTLLSIDNANAAANMALSVGVFDDAARERYTEEFAALDPAPAAFAAIPVGTASTTQRVLSAETRRDSAFLHEFFRPLGLTETIGGNLRVGSGRFELIGLQRGPDRSAFEDAEIAHVERLMPHIARALQIRRAFMRIESKLVGLEHTADRMRAGMVLLAADGAALFVNRAMLAIAGSGDGLGLDRRGWPTPANAEVSARFDALVSDVARGGVGGVLKVPRPSGRISYAMLVAPAPKSGLPLQRSELTSVLVIVHDPASGQVHSNPDLLRSALGLTKGSARLVAALIADDNLKSFAEREGVTIHTARFHLRTALARTGTRSQAELVRLAVRLLRDFGLQDEDSSAN